MFEYAKVNPIYGPPGTGKTTQCVAIVSDLIEKGVDPRRIAYVAFTNKAANEARERVAEKLKIPTSGMNYFSTIHAMGNRAYRAEFPDSQRVMRPKDFEDVGERASLPVRAHWKITEDADFIGTGGVQYGPGDFAISQINLARARRISLTEQMGQASPGDFHRFDCRPEQVTYFGKTLESFKKVEGKYDFDDMLERSTDCTPIPVEYAIIDEAQDLSAAQWHVCDALMRNCKEIWIAGDDDQAIYRFSGAAADTFLHMGSNPNARVLNRTYRLPQSVFTFANGIISKVQERVPKDWHSEKAEGSVQSVPSMAELDIESGEWLLLVRNRGFMKGFEERLRAGSYAYNLDGRSSLPFGHLVAIRAWEKVRKNHVISLDEVKAIYARMRVGQAVERGHKSNVVGDLSDAGVTEVRWDDLPGVMVNREAPWFDALQLIEDKLMGYLRGVAKRGELFDEPRISLNTIHGVKGGEADNVAVLPSMGRLTFETYLQSPDDEHRCAYVAATRAKENLYVLSSEHDMEYPYF